MSSSPERGPLNFDPRLIRALSHPLRIRILELLSEWPEGSPSSMAPELGVPLSNVAYHTKVLFEDCQCLELVRTVQRRGAQEHFYRVRSDPFMWSARPTGVPRSLRGGIAAAALRLLVGAAVAALTQHSFQKREGSTLSCTPMTVDEEGWTELTTAIGGLPERLQEIQANSARRLAGAAGISVVVGVHGFEVAPRPEGAAP